MTPAASDLAFRKVVTVLPGDTDRYGRAVAVLVLPDGRNLNHEMVRSGPAWPGLVVPPLRAGGRDELDLGPIARHARWLAGV